MPVLVSSVSLSSGTTRRLRQPADIPEKMRLCLWRCMRRCELDINPLRDVGDARRSDARIGRGAMLHSRVLAMACFCISAFRQVADRAGESEALDGSIGRATEFAMGTDGNCWELLTSAFHADIEG